MASRRVEKGRKQREVSGLHLFVIWSRLDTKTRSTCPDRLVEPVGVTRPIQVELSDMSFDGQVKLDSGSRQNKGEHIPLTREVRW